MKSMKKYSLLKYGYPDCVGTVNIGDYIQSLAAMQYLPGNYSLEELPLLIDREQLSTYEGENVKMIMNGWYMHSPENWPPSENIEPLFLSMHFNSTVANKVLTLEGVDYLKKYQPIGCRDYETKALLESYNIKAYFSGCLTLTLNREWINKITSKSIEEDSDRVLFVDPCFSSKNSLYRSLQYRKIIGKKEIKEMNSIPLISQSKPEKFMKLYKKLFDEETLNNSFYIRHEIPRTFFNSEKERFEYAAKLLKYYSSAKLVVTSRIHAALPCLALGIPVIFIRDMKMKYAFSSRYQGLIDLFNVINLNGESFDSEDIDIETLKKADNPALTNKKLFIQYADRLKTDCKDFINS